MELSEAHLSRKLAFRHDLEVGACSLEELLDNFDDPETVLVVDYCFHFLACKHLIPVASFSDENRDCNCVLTMKVKVASRLGHDFM